MRQHVQPEVIGIKKASGLRRATPHGLRTITKTKIDAFRTIPVLFNCTVNRTCFTIVGEIKILSGAGHAIAHCSFVRDSLPLGFQPELLSYVAITGYPDASLKIGKAINPFSDQNADFITERALDLGAYGHLKTTYASTGRGTPHERIDFSVEGTVDVAARIIGIEPLCEVWKPILGAKDRFTGRMPFIWRLDKGEPLMGYATGTYSIASDIPLLHPQMRVITFDLESGPNHFRQIEAIRLFDLAEWNAR